jgi:hypothetical protein
VGQGITAARSHQQCFQELFHHLLGMKTDHHIFGIIQIRQLTPPSFGLIEAMNWPYRCARPTRWLGESAH